MRADPDFEAHLTDLVIARRARAQAQEQIQAGQLAREKAEREIRDAQRALEGYIEARVEAYPAG